MSKIIKIAELIAKKAEMLAKTDKTKELYVKSINGNIIIKRPDKALTLEAIDMKNNADEFMVYNCVIEPNLKDKQLQEAYNCVTPMEIVEKLFEFGEITQIARECARLAGFHDSVDIVEDIKK